MRFLAISDTFLVSRHAERAACLLIGASAGAALTYYFYFRASASQGEWAVDEVTEPSKEAPEHKVIVFMKEMHDLRIQSLKFDCANFSFNCMFCVFMSAVAC